MPIVQMHNVRFFIQRAYPASRGDTEKREFCRVGSEGSIYVTTKVNASGALLVEQCVMQDDIFDVAFGWYAPDLEIEPLSAKFHGKCGYWPGTAQAVQGSVRRCGHAHAPAGLRQRLRQVAHNVADAADLTTGQGTVLRREEYDLSFNDAA